MSTRVVTVFGGSGFIGRHVVRRLAASGAIVRVAVRDPEDALFLKPMGDVGQVVPVAASVLDADSTARAVSGSDAVVNCVGILSEWRSQRFTAIHAEGAATVAACARDAGVSRLVHISAIGADPESDSVYARTKGEGEAAVKAAFPSAVIVRPSVVFGADDNFFNLFAGLSRLTPVLPVFGCPPMPRLVCGGGEDGKACGVDIYGDGGTKFQPVYAGDVGDAIMAALDDNTTAGKTYELGGPGVYSFKQVMELMLSTIGRKRLLAPIPFWVGSFYAWFLEMWPKPILTRDQVRLLQNDNVVSGDLPGLQELGISPTAAESILPTYLSRFRLPNAGATKNA